MLNFGLFVVGLHHGVQRTSGASCSGFGVLDEEWDYLDYLAPIAAENPLPYDGKKFLYDLLQRLQHHEQLAPASAACPGPIFTTIAQSLFLIEASLGEAAMRSALERARTLSAQVPSEWAPLAQLAWAEWYPPRRDAASCSSASKDMAGRVPRVFVYDSGRLAQRPLECSAGMEGVEVLFHHFFLSASCRVMNPHDADLFYAPFYSFCYQNQNLAPGNETAELDALNRELISGLTYFTPDQRSRHIFLYAHEFWDFPSWREFVRSSILFAVEANPLEYPGDDVSAPPHHCLDCFVPSKDVVLPGHTDHWTTRQMLELAMPFESRPYLACYHGAFSHHLYDDAVAPAPFNKTAGQVRAALAALTDDTRLSVGPHLRPVRRYYERLGQCRFCFVPKGVGFTNGRLMETFFTGCVPVILSDAMVVPFDDLLDWPSFSIKWPMPTHSVEAKNLVNYLAELPFDLVLDMHERLRMHRCWFDYVDNREDCSPYEGVVKLLQRRLQIPRRHWRPY